MKHCPNIRQKAPNNALQRAGSAVYGHEGEQAGAYAAGDPPPGAASPQEGTVEGEFREV